MRHIFFANESLIGCVEQQQSAMFTAIINPRFQLAAGQSGSGRIVRIAEIYHIGIVDREGGHKTVFSRTGQIFDLSPAAVGSKIPGAASHYVRIDINRIDRIGYSHTIGRREDIANISGVAFGSVTDKDLIGVYFYASFTIIITCDFFGKKRIALLRTISVKSFACRLIVHRFMERLDSCLTQRTGHITDAHAYYVCAGMAFGISIYPAGHLTEKI